MIKVKIFNENSFKILEHVMSEFFQNHKYIEKTDIIKMEFNRDGSPVCKLVYEV